MRAMDDWQRNLPGAFNWLNRYFNGDFPDVDPGDETPVIRVLQAVEAIVRDWEQARPPAAYSLSDFVHVSKATPRRSADRKGGPADLQRTPLSVLTRQWECLPLWKQARSAGKAVSGFSDKLAGTSTICPSGKSNAISPRHGTQGSLAPPINRRGYFVSVTP